MNAVKLLSRYSSSNLTKKYIINRKILNFLNIQFCCNATLKNFLVELNENSDFFDRIVYSEVLGPKKLRKDMPETFEPLCLKYLIKDENDVQGSTTENDEKPEIVHFPYEPRTTFLKEYDENISVLKSLPQTVRDFTPSDNEKDTEFEWQSLTKKVKLRLLEHPGKWQVPGTFEIKVDDSDKTFEFGSSDPKKPISSIPCGGCGALLHCNDPSIPGFIPLEIFESIPREELRGEICQRCIFLKKLDMALGVNVKASEYPKIISAIKEKEAMVILMIDMLDLPCSIYPEILDLIGPKPVVIVGNKVDLLIREGPQFLKYFQEALIWSLKKHKISFKNIKHVALISAKTGYGVENLIDVLNTNWGCKGDIYLVGCTNSGKSTLFNTLIQSDFCKIQAADVLQRATVSSWPGTTLNLIKFPIAKPTESKLYARSLRLKMQRPNLRAFDKMQWLGQNLKLEQIPLKGYVGRTGKEAYKKSLLDNTDDGSDEITRKGINTALPNFARGYWFYDTPGVVHEDQIINLLTTAELLVTIPRNMLIPRNFHLGPGYSLFIGGLARLDYIKGKELVWFTVFASMGLPVTVTKLEDADHVYEKLLGTPLFVVPMEGKERLAKWPKLSSKTFEITGKPPRLMQKLSGKGSKWAKEAEADVVLSSAGWVSVTVPETANCSLEAWTPQGRGIHLREVPIIKRAFSFRGSRIQGTPAFSVIMKEVEGLSVTEEPSFL